ncbi:EGF domain-specific O-linked N-acetylglucosamine transferase [Planococcus citri]|uniref:EGF domain-specific O-linked N-acetylglucosamine transferase n=1 Tax=Planococcus citri TaxID=170843 RepID=UPI0031F9507F
MCTKTTSIIFRVVILIYCIVPFTICDKLDDLNLPSEHLPYYFNTYKDVLQEYCKETPNHDFCGNKKSKSCWGYELNCDSSNSYHRPVCPGSYNGWVQSKKEQISTFYNQADFGFVREQRNEMMLMCEPSFKEDSSLECSNHLRFCRGRNIFINFTSLASRKEPIRYKMDVLKDGEIGGFCNFKKPRLLEECDHLSPLQSWGPELQHFTALRRPPIPHNCDVVVNEPTFIMKIDATVNMYHHFCDFFNLYASLHVNSSHEDTFSRNVRILIWESYTYQSAFSATFDTFTKYPIWDLKTFAGQTVCFKNVVFPLLPRMIFGLYYNTPLIGGCERSGLFHAFSKFILHRLDIPTFKRHNKRFKVTFLSRDTMYRKVLNERQLLHALSANTSYDVNRVVFDRNYPLKDQLKIIHNTDIFISIHGAGLTHLLFLPDWAAVFELYNCEDPSCYYDLARLRGVKYVTWQDQLKLYQQDENHPERGAHAKFTNYKFDVDEFLKLVEVAAKHVSEQENFPGHYLNDRDEL